MESALPLDLGPCVVRDWLASDAPALARHANSRAVWRNLRDAFPHPYTPADADLFLGVVRAMEPRTFFAIAVDGEAAGGIGYRLKGRMRRSAIRDGVVLDQLLYAAVRDEWEGG